MPNIFISSDWHFGHINITGPKVSKWKTGYRDFDSVEEMNAIIINNLNSVIMSQDILYFLGDFAFGDKKRIPEYRERINCRKIYFARGNHDKAIDQNPEYQKLFENYREAYEIYYKGYPISMNHYAQRVWNESHHNGISLWGHSHATLPETPYRSMDCGVDCVYPEINQPRYMPFLLDTIIERLKDRESTKLDHHSQDTDRKGSYVSHSTLSPDW